VKSLTDRRTLQVLLEVRDRFPANGPPSAADVQTALGEMGAPGHPFVASNGQQREIEMQYLVGLLDGPVNGVGPGCILASQDMATKIASEFGTKFPGVTAVYSRGNLTLSLAPNTAGTSHEIVSFASGADSGQKP